MRKKKQHKKRTKNTVALNQGFDDSYVKCLRMFKDKAISTVTKRFPLDPRRILDETIEGIDMIFKNSPTVPLLTLGGSLLIKFLDYLLQNQEELWRQSSEEFSIDQVDFEKHLFKVIYLTIFFAPLIEETLFRGAITPVLKYSLEKLGVDEQKSQQISRWLSSIYFGSLHNKQTFVGATSGAMLTFEPLVTKHNGSLWGSIAAHMTNNVIALSSTIVRKAFSVAIS